MTVTATRISIDDIHQLPDGVFAVTGYLRWVASRCCNKFAAND